MNERDIRGYIALLMGLSSVAALRELLRDLIRRTIGEIPPVAYVATVIPISSRLRSTSLTPA